jgi:hypothetical protein
MRPKPPLARLSTGMETQGAVLSVQKSKELLSRLELFLYVKDQILFFTPKRKALNRQPKTPNYQL